MEGQEEAQWGKLPRLLEGAEPWLERSGQVSPWQSQTNDIFEKKKYKLGDCICHLFILCPEEKWAKRKVVAASPCGPQDPGLSFLFRCPSIYAPPSRTCCENWGLQRACHLHLALCIPAT